MRLYEVSCKQCGWKGQRYVEEADVQHFIGHRCRECLKRDPASTKLFDVKELIFNLSSFGRKE